MKIGILGAGNIGGNLGTLWAARGHEIVFGVRDPHSDKVQALLTKIGSNARAASVQEAASNGDLVVLAVHWPVAVPEVLAQTDGLSGKILVDCTNRMAPPAPGSAASAAEEIARLVPGAKVVKAFSTLGANNLANLQFGSENASTFICGNDPDAKAVVTQLGQEIGFDVVDAGPLANASLLESLTKIWVQLSRHLGREIAFKLLRR